MKNQRQNQKLRQNLYRISLVSFVVIVMWIGFEVYWAFSEDPEINVDRTLLEPLSTEMYISQAQELDEREVISQETLQAFLENLPESQAQEVIETVREADEASAEASPSSSLN